MRGVKLKLQPQRVDNFFVAARRQTELQRAEVGVLLHEQHRRAAANAAERVADGDGSRRGRVADPSLGCGLPPVFVSIDIRAFSGSGSARLAINARTKLRTLTAATA